MINYLALVVALCLSAVSGYYSIVGLTALFAAAFWPVVIMGTALEAGKLVTASWLYRNWNTAPEILKAYLLLSILVLMFITSMGTFGFLTKAHIDQTLAVSGESAQKIQIIDQKIENIKLSVSDIDKQISQIDAAVNKMTDRGQATSSLRAAEQQRKTRDALIKKRDDHVKDISELTTERVRLNTDIKKLEAEVGPLKYISEIIYNDQSSESIERSVRIVIILLVSVFDPLAIVLLIAANHGIATSRRLTIIGQKDTIEITDKDILKI